MKSKSRFWLPSFADIFFLLPFLFLSLDGGNQLLNDAGTGFHIRAGQYILSQMAVPRYDVFSHIAPPLPWLAHEWLSEVSMALIQRSFGLTGIVVFFAFLIALTYFIFFRLIRSLSDNIISPFLICLLACLSSALHWLARPHAFTITFTLAWYAVLENHRSKNKNYLLLLPLMMLLWVNLHGGFVVGFLLLAIYLSGYVAEALFASEPQNELSRQKFRALLYTALGCLIAALLNPAAYHVLFFPFKLALNPSLVDIIMEYRSPNFHQALPFKYLLLLTIAILAVSRAAVNLIELLLVILFTYMALYSERHIPLFAIIIAPILVRRIDLMMRSREGVLSRWFTQRFRKLAEIDTGLSGHLWPLAALLLVCAMAGMGLIRFHFNPARMPIAAVEFLNRAKIQGKMYNPEQFGDYVIYAAWPQYKVFIDGRIDMYGPDTMRDYMTVATLEPGWRAILAKYDINFIFYHANSPLSSLLKQRDDWRLVYADRVANIFVKNSAENRTLIGKYSDVKPALSAQ